MCVSTWGIRVHTQGNVLVVQAAAYTTETPNQLTCWPRTAFPLSRIAPVPFQCTWHIHNTGVGWGKWGFINTQVRVSKWYMPYGDADWTRQSLRAIWA